MNSIDEALEIIANVKKDKEGLPPNGEYYRLYKLHTGLQFSSYQMVREFYNQRYLSISKVLSPKLE